MKFKAEIGHWSSIVGNSVHLIGEDGRFLGQIAIMCQDDWLRAKDAQTAICEKICAALNADLCASGQVRALDVDDLAQIIRVVDGNNTLGAGELAEAILEAMPAPQPEGQGALKISSEYQALFDEVKQRAQPEAATPTAQEAVAWRCKDYADGWILYGNKAQAELYQACTGCLMEALFAHPPQPSETVAEAAIRALAECIRDMEDAGINSPASAHAALRALKGDGE